MTAFRKRAMRKPSTAMNGIRSAAAIGGSAALRIAIRSAVTSAPLKPSTEMPGRSQAAIRAAAAAVSTHVSRTGNSR